jgi:hypothetical protein
VAEEYFQSEDPVRLVLSIARRAFWSMARLTAESATKIIRDLL